MTTERLWSMYNKLERLRIEGLRADQVRTILLAIPARRMEHWYACAENGPTWHCLTDIPEFFDDVHALKGAKEIGHRQVTALNPERFQRRLEDAPAQWAAGSEFDRQTLTFAERRAARRYPRDLNFLIKNGTAEFRSETHDISFTGVSIKNPLPPWVPQTFQATLGRDEHETEVLCTRVSDSRLQIVDSKSWDVLRTWIAGA